MKKLISLVLAVAMICALTTVAFANDLEGSYKFVGTASDIVDGTFTYTVNLVEDGADSFEIVTQDATWSFALTYDSEAFEVVGTPVVNAGFGYDATFSKSEAGSYLTVLNATGASVAFTSETALATYTFKVLEGAEGEKAFGVDEIDISDADSFAALEVDGNLTVDFAPVTLGTVGPTENVATYVTNELALDVAGEIKNFTDVPVYEATTTATSFKLKAVYGEEYNYLKFNGAEEINVSNIKVDGDGEVSFQVAIIGVPAGVTIDKLIVE